MTAAAVFSCTSWSTFKLANASAASLIISLWSYVNQLGIVITQSLTCPPAWISDNILTYWKSIATVSSEVMIYSIGSDSPHFSRMIFHPTIPRSSSTKSCLLNLSFLNLANNSSSYFYPKFLYNYSKVVYGYFPYSLNESTPKSLFSFPRVTIELVFL